MDSSQADKTLERYRLLFEHSRDILLFVRVRDGRILEANLAAEKAYGYTREELLELAIHELRAPGERHLIRHQLEQANTAGILFETVHQHKDGTIFPVEVSSLGADFGEERVNLSIVRDIRERRQAECERARLEIENQRHQALLDAIFEADPSGLAVVSGEDLRFEYANPAYRLISQHPQSDIIGQPYSAVWPGENGELELRIRQVLETGRPFLLPGVEHVFPDWTRCIFTIQARRVEWDGEAAVLLIYWDTTDLVRVEHALRESEARYRTTLVSLGDAVITTDNQARVTFLNPVAELLTGWSLADAAGETVERVFPLIDEISQKPAENPVRAALEQGCAIGLANHTLLVSRDERLVPIEDSAAVIKDPTGAITGAVMVFHDVTEKRRAEHALRASEEQYRSLFTSMSEGFALHEIIVDAQGKPADYRFLEVNPAFEQMTGLRRDDILGRTVLEVMPGTKSYWIETYGQVALTGEPAHFQNFSQELGKWFDVITFSPGPEMFAVLFVDITGRKQVEIDNYQKSTRIELQQRLIEQRELERMQIARDIHDGPLQGLLAANFAVQKLAQDPESPVAPADLENLRTNVHIVINELRSYAMQLRPPTLAKFGLEQALRSHLEGLHSEHPEIEFHLDAVQQGELLPEPARLALFRIYQEAVSNILKHSAARQVDILFRKDHQQTVLEIRDDGVGFTPPGDWLELARQGHLGLVGMRERAEAVGGTLEVRSQPGKGTRICITVPLRVKSEV